MDYILVCKGMEYIGGLQSIVIRVANFLARRGDRVIVISDCGRQTGYLATSVHKLPYDCSVTDLPLTYRNVLVVIVAFEPISTARSAILADALFRLGHDVRLATGVFHPRDYFRETEKKHAHLLNFILGRLILNNMFFMNSECCETHIRFFKARNDFNGNVIPVPLDERTPMWRERLTDRILICSVGRIVPFKGYNFVAREVAEALQQSGISVLWDIYGHGSHEDKLRNMLTSSPHVVFNGLLAFEDFDTIVAKADLFVGMGTAALQAAQLGVPTLLAIEGKLDDIHGFIHEVPIGNLGEQLCGHKSRKLTGEIRKFFESSPVDRSAISEKGRMYASNFSTRSFVAKIDEKFSYVNLKFKRILLVYARFYLWMSRMNAVRRVSVRSRKRS